jgi:photosystem II stability/assembly factor-like uncharacterized protein
MTIFRVLVFAGLLTTVSGAAWSAANAADYDVLELPAVPSSMASKSMIHAIKKFGDRYFATGHHGHILYSDDGGDSWTQAEVPVRSSIVDIDFPTPELGWAVGHEGVILHSSDGGKTWVKQFDGLRYAKEGLPYYQALAEANPDNEVYPMMVEEMEFSMSQGADRPLFGVSFHNENFGHAGGAYGMLLRTLDGGKNWEPVIENVENDGFYHIFDFAPLPGEGRFFLSGEAGLFIVGDIKARVGRKIENIPFTGSFFTVIDTSEGNIVLGGLRGKMFRTEDAGESWTTVKKPMTSAIVDSTRLEDGRLVAVGIGGEVLISADDGVSFASVAVTNGAQLYTVGGRNYAVAEGSPGTLLLGGPSGINKINLPQ